MSETVRRFAATLVLVFAACGGSTKVAAVGRIVVDVRRADYRGDLDGLLRAERALAVHAEDPALADPVRYWRGFALWRLALNRMNEPDFDKSLAIQDLRGAIDAFLAVRDPGLTADAKSAAAGCMMSLGYLLGIQQPESRELIPRFRALLGEASAAAPDNPRVLWILGGQLLWTPPQFGGDRAKALETYRRGLAAARATRTSSDPLTPTWGEPEILMTLAFAYSTFEPFDYPRAEAYAREALALVPDWHYVRDILLPGIVTKRSHVRNGYPTDPSIFSQMPPLSKCLNRPSPRAASQTTCATS